MPYQDRNARRWMRVPFKRLRSLAARLTGRCRVYFWDRTTQDYTLYLWSQRHGDHCRVIGWRSHFSVVTPKVGNG